MPANPFRLVVIVVVIAALLVGTSVFFTVKETEQALVLRFGEVRRQHQDAGLHLKLPPPFETVHYIEKRNLELRQTEQEIVAADQERLIVDAFARYKIIDAVLFYQTVNNERGANNRLLPILGQSLRAVLGTVESNVIISEQRSDLMLQIRDALDEGARDFGIEIMDVKIRRADLPNEVSESVYERMRSDRQQEASQIRAEGSEASTVIRAEADREVIDITSKAEEEALKIRGAADGERTRILGETYGQDAEFYAFLGSLEAYQQSLRSGETTMVLSPDSEFFRYFGDVDGR